MVKERFYQEVFFMQGNGVERKFADLHNLLLHRKYLVCLSNMRSVHRIS